MQVVVDTLITHYETKGKGKTILLLHGWADSAAGLQNLQNDLAKKYTVIAIDLPGAGSTQPPPRPWGLDDYAQFLQHFLQKIDAAPLHALVGHSNGGAIAIRGVASGLLSSDKLVLLASAGIRGTDRGRLGALRLLAKAGKIVTMPLPKAVKRRLRSGLYKQVGSDMLVAEHLQETFKKVVTDDVRNDAAQLSQPTLLIYGEKDDAAPVWYGEAYRDVIPEATLEILPGAGHFVHLDRPQEVARFIEEFVQ
jgi:pimeloyl-ACP methyl ester carboxylesterase